MTATGKPEETLKFSLEILLSETLEFNLGEIEHAIAEDFPENAVTVPSFMPLENIKTDEIVLAALQPADPANGGLITLSGAGFPDESFRAADHTELAWRSGAPFAQQALDAIKTHQSYISLSISVTDTSLAGRFRAARQLTAVAAVFAQLPIALGVLVHWTSHMVAPARWVESAHESMTGKWPLIAWIAYRAGFDHAWGAENQMAVAYTIGLAQFLDLEFHLEPAPILPTDAMLILMGACWLPLEGGSNYNDGDTMGVQNSDLKYTMRRRKHADGSVKPIMSLLHPDCPLDEEQEFGPNPMMKPPEGFDNERHYKTGFMERLLGKNRRKVH